MWLLKPEQILKSRWDRPVRLVGTRSNQVRLFLRFRHSLFHSFFSPFLITKPKRDVSSRHLCLSVWLSRGCSQSMSNLLWEFIVSTLNKRLLFVSFPFTGQLTRYFRKSSGRSARRTFFWQSKFKMPRIWKLTLRSRVWCFTRRQERMCTNFPCLFQRR